MKFTFIDFANCIMACPGGAAGTGQTDNVEGLLDAETALLNQQFGLEIDDCFILLVSSV